MNQDVLKVLFNEKEIKDKVKELGKKISDDYKDKDLVLITVLKGAVIFLSDLMREIDVHCDIDFMVVSSYGSGTKTSGVVKIKKDVDVNIEGRDIVIIEDILDSGMTLQYIMGILQSRNPNSIEVCTLLNKPARREVDMSIKYNGFTIPDEFVVGYGLDYSEKYRNLPYIGVLKPEIYT